jgi:hypothetical protein
VEGKGDFLKSFLMTVSVTVAAVVVLDGGWWCSEKTWRVRNEVMMVVMATVTVVAVVVLDGKWWC